jgi:hypothetical protein
VYLTVGYLLTISLTLLKGRSSGERVRRTRRMCFLEEECREVDAEDNG